MSLVQGAKYEPSLQKMQCFFRPVTFSGSQYFPQQFSLSQNIDQYYVLRLWGN